MENKGAGGGWGLQVECALRCKCEFVLSPTYNTALNPFVHTLMHMRSRIANTSTRLEARRSNKLWKRTIQRKASSCRGREKAASKLKALLFIFLCHGPLAPFCLFLLLCLEPRSIYLLNCALRLAIARRTSTKTGRLELHLSVTGRTAGTFEGGISQRSNAIASQNKQAERIAVLRAC